MTNVRLPLAGGGAPGESAASGEGRGAPGESAANGQGRGAPGGPAANGQGRGGPGGPAASGGGHAAASGEPAGVEGRGGPRERAAGERPRRVLLVEIPVFPGTAPLASGYLEACARQDPRLASWFSFEKKSFATGTPYERMRDEIVGGGYDVYGFSCYVWNAGLVRQLAAEIGRALPDAYVMLGGPQVMHQGGRYLDPARERLLLCDGEGEVTFANFLRETLAERPDFGRVRGVSYCRDGAVVSTEPEPRIVDLSQVPSPYLEGLIDLGKYVWYLVETNRGCPFRCNYCYWGAAIGARVYKYDERRVEREIDLICRSGGLHLYLCDANWGMLPRDLEISKYIAACKRRHNTPYSVQFSTSKNTPKRVTEICDVFHEAGLLATQTISLQTMSDEALRLVERDNIRASTYTEVQSALNDRGVASLIELIWPLPGETLASFREGVGRLCALEAQSFNVYPLLLMSNVGLNARREEFGLVTVDDPDPASEAEMVVATKWVGPDDYTEGLRFAYALQAAYAQRGLWCTLRHLDARGLRGFADSLADFAAFCKGRPDHPYVAYCEESIATGAVHTFYNVGGVMHTNLHARREEFDQLLYDFISATPFWADPEVRFCFELDLVNRPYVYRTTPIREKPYAFEQLEVRATASGYQVGVGAERAGLVRRALGAFGSPREAGATYAVNHRRGQMPFMPKKSLKDLYGYCQGLANKGQGYLAEWTTTAAAGRREAAPRAEASAGGAAD